MNSSVVACAIVKNEASYLLEWVAYHRLIGVDHFLFYENDSSDETWSILQKLHRLGWATCIRWPSRPKVNNQKEAYKNAIKRTKNRFDWVAFIDLDEFIVLDGPGSLKGLLQKFDFADAVAINWKMFGSSGATEKLPGLVMERFRRCAVDAFYSNENVKSVVRPEKVKRVDSVHVFELFAGWENCYQCDGLPLEFGVGRRAKRVTYQGAQINHYFTKSLAEWRVKRVRGKANVPIGDPERVRDSRVFGRLDRNEAYDDRIQPWCEPTRVEMARLTALMADLPPEQSLVKRWKRAFRQCLPTAKNSSAAALEH